MWFSSLLTRHYYVRSNTSRLFSLVRPTCVTFEIHQVQQSRYISSLFMRSTPCSFLLYWNAREFSFSISSIERVMTNQISFLDALLLAQSTHTLTCFLGFCRCEKVEATFFLFLSRQQMKVWIKTESILQHMDVTKRVWIAARIVIACHATKLSNSSLHTINFMLNSWSAW